MFTKVSITLIGLLLSIHSLFAQSNQLVLKTANGHPMQYYISLPEGWTKNKKWHAVIVLEAAEKEYKINAGRFVSARGKMPFIIVAPIHTGNGNQGRRDPAIFPYSKETWDYIDQVGDCKFNEDGIQQILKDVQTQFNSESKFFITGFEAGAHLLWAMAFNHPENWKACAPVACNFINRCVDEGNISKDASKATLPIMAFVSEDDQFFGPSGTNFNQWLNAKNLGSKNGFNSISITILKGKGHAPVPTDVLNYFYSISKE